MRKRSELAWLLAFASGIHEHGLRQDSFLRLVSVFLASGNGQLAREAGRRVIALSLSWDAHYFPADLKTAPHGRQFSRLGLNRQMRRALRNPPSYQSMDDDDAVLWSPLEVRLGACGCCLTGALRSDLGNEAYEEAQDDHTKHAVAWLEILDFDEGCPPTLEAAQRVYEEAMEHPRLQTCWAGLRYLVWHPVRDARERLAVYRLVLDGMKAKFAAHGLVADKKEHRGLWNISQDIDRNLKLCFSWDSIGEIEKIIADIRAFGDDEPRAVFDLMDWLSQQHAPLDLILNWARTLPNDSARWRLLHIGAAVGAEQKNRISRADPVARALGAVQKVRAMPIGKMTR